MAIVEISEGLFELPPSPPPELPEIHSFFHQAGLVEIKLTEIDIIIGDIWLKERKCYQESLRSHRTDMFARLLELSEKSAEIQQVLIDLKKSQKENSLPESANQSPEESEKAAHLKCAYFRLLVKFQESSSLAQLSDSFDEFLSDLNKEVVYIEDLIQFPESPLDSSFKSLRRAHSEDLPGGAFAELVEVDTSVPKARNSLSFFDSLYDDFTKELKQVADLDKKLKESESRLRSRDEYLQSTIIETAKRTHTLEQTVAELQSEKQDLVNELESIQGSQQSTSPRLRPPKKTPKSITTITAKEIQEEEEVERWIMEANFKELDNSTLLDERAEYEELLALTESLTTLAEEKKLLESDLCIVRLQVEHLEAISKERDAVLNALVRKRRENQLKSPQYSTRISRLSKAY